MITKAPDYHVGQVVKLKFDVFKTDKSNKLVKENHPFCIVGTTPLVVCEVSSTNKVSDKYPWNVEIKDLSSTGLRLPSHVKTDEYGEIEPEDIFKVYGELSSRDLNNVLGHYYKAPQNFKFEWLVFERFEYKFIKTKLCESDNL